MTDKSPKARLSTSHHAAALDARLDSTQLFPALALLLLTALPGSAWLPSARLPSAQVGSFLLRLDSAGLGLASTSWFHAVLSSPVPLFSTSCSRVSEEQVGDGHWWQRMESTGQILTTCLLDRRRQKRALPGLCSPFLSPETKPPWDDVGGKK